MRELGILITGSNGYENFRHQADVCHAYQVLKEGGLKDENIVVFMYDDITNNVENPTPGIIINQPNGKNVYAGVPKDYTGNDVNAENFFAALLGNAAALTGGSGKVIKSGPNDNIFIYFSGYGASRLLGMPGRKLIYANDFVNVLKEKHATNSFKSMVIYVESCESGSMFEGLLPDNLNIYAVTASGAAEKSYTAYCPPESPYDTCLGDAFSVAWMEDSDKNDRQTRTLSQQYEAVRQRTTSSRVTQYGDLNLQNNFLSDYIGGTHIYSKTTNASNILSPSPKIFSQYDMEMLYFKHKSNKARLGSKERYESHQQSIWWYTMVHADGSVLQTWNYLSQHGLQGFMDIWPRPTAIAWKIIACYAAFEAALQLLLPGKRVEGPISPSGNRPVYKVSVQSVFWAL